MIAGITASTRRGASAALLAPTDLVATLVEPTLPDPYWDNVVALLHFDGDFTDETGGFWQKIGSSGLPIIDTDNPKFGDGAGEFGVNGGLARDYSTHVNLTGVDFTIEAFLQTEATSGSPTILDFRGSSSWSSGWIVYFNAASKQVSIYNGLIPSVVFTSPVLPVGTDYWHFALVRSGSTVSLYVKGVLSGSANITIPATTTTGVRLGINQAMVDPWIGDIDELRITKGVARYTENFTPPTGPFPNFGPTPEPTPTLPTVIGEPYGGGFYAGDIQYPDGQWYKLIVADKSADITGASSRWKTTVDDSPGTNHLVDGLANTQAMAIVGIELHPAGGHCLDYRGGGFDDWYMASKDELNAVFLGLGPNRPSCPLIFRSGGLQAFDELAWYWASTQRSAANAWSQHFSDGTQNEQYQGGKYVDDHRVRPIRRIAFTPD